VLVVSSKCVDSMRCVSTQVNHSDYTTQCAPKYPDDAKSYAHLALAMLTCYLIPMIVIVVCSGIVLRLM